MYLPTDKSSILHEIEKNTEAVPNNIMNSPDLRRVIMFDSMAVVNQIKKLDAMHTCKDFAGAFVLQFMHAAENLCQIRVIFSNYVDSSLNETTQKKSTGRVTVRYKVRKLGRPIPLFITISVNQTRLLMTVSNNMSMKKSILF